jgi:MFS transporter, DHA2 family, multidrug resistance protein
VLNADGADGPSSLTQPTRYLEPTQAAGRVLLERRIAGPVVMLNLLRFRAVADYSAFPARAPPVPISGAEERRASRTHACCRWSSCCCQGDAGRRPRMSIWHPVVRRRDMTTHKAPRSAWIGLAVLSLPCMITVMDMTVLNLAVPHLSLALKPTGTQLLWIIDIYGFMLAGALIPVGGLGDRIGRRKLLLVGSAAFGTASVLAAFSTSALMLIATRALLGLAGAALVPSTLSLLRTMFEDDAERTRAIGVWGASFAVGAAIGPLVGGVLLEHFWWGSVFLVGVPIMVLLLIAGPILLPEYRDAAAGRPDVPSALLSISSVLAVIYGLKQVVQDGLGWLPLLAILVGLGLAASFLRRQRTLDDPMLDLGLFRNAAFNVSLASNVLNVFVSFGSFILVSQYLQLVLGLSPLQAGLLSLPASALAIAGPMLSPLLVQRLGMPFTLAGLLAIAAVGFGVQALVGGPLAALTAACGWALWAFGGSAAATLTTGTIIGSAPAERAGAVSALAQTGAELGGALGIAVLGSLGTAIYRGMVAASLPEGLAPEVAAAARDTLGGALSVAGQIPDAAAAAALVLTAQDALTTAVHVTSAIGAIVSLLSAVVVAICLSRGERVRECETSSLDETCQVAAWTGAE